VRSRSSSWPREASKFRIGHVQPPTGARRQSATGLSTPPLPSSQVTAGAPVARFRAVKGKLGLGNVVSTAIPGSRSVPEGLHRPSLRFVLDGGYLETSAPGRTVSEVS
jgi:hypothetical protein